MAKDRSTPTKAANRLSPFKDPSAELCKFSGCSPSRVINGLRTVDSFPSLLDFVGFRFGSGNSEFGSRSISRFGCSGILVVPSIERLPWERRENVVFRNRRRIFLPTTPLSRPRPFRPSFGKPFSPLIPSNVPSSRFTRGDKSQN